MSEEEEEEERGKGGRIREGGAGSLTINIVVTSLKSGGVA